MAEIKKERAEDMSKQKSKGLISKPPSPIPTSTSRSWAYKERTALSKAIQTLELQLAIGKSGTSFIWAANVARVPRVWGMVWNAQRGKTAGRWDPGTALQTTGLYNFNQRLEMKLFQPSSSDRWAMDLNWKQRTHAFPFFHSGKKTQAGYQALKLDRPLP